MKLTAVLVGTIVSILQMSGSANAQMSGESSTKVGEYAFTYGMRMFRGTIEVKAK